MKKVCSVPANAPIRLSILALCWAFAKNGRYQHRALGDVSSNLRCSFFSVNRKIRRPLDLFSFSGLFFRHFHPCENDPPAAYCRSFLLMPFGMSIRTAMLGRGGYGPSPHPGRPLFPPI